MKYLWLLVVVLCAPLRAAPLRAVTENLPPYQVVQQGKLTGTSVAVVRAMLNRAGLNVPIELLPWARAYYIAMSQPNVLIFSMSRNKDRETSFHWLLKLRSLTYHFYSLASRKTLQTSDLSKLLSHTVAAVRDSYAANSLQKIGFVAGKNLILTLSYKDAWQMLMIGRADYTYANEEVQLTTLGPLNIPADLFVQSSDYAEHADLYLAASADSSPEILKKLTHSLQTMRDDGTLHKLMATAELPTQE